MNSPSILSGAKNKMAPLISFYTIFDLDVGLIQLIYDEYLNSDVFNTSFFERSLLEIIKDLYYRKEENPLYLFAKDTVEKDILDKFYQEFKESCMDKILDKTVTTEIINMISIFTSSSEIVPTILYYSDKQKEILEEEPDLKNISKISITQLNQDNKNSFSQFYFKSINELEPFANLNAKTFYISNYGPNLNDVQTDIKDSDIILKIVKNRNQINIFNLYNENILRKDM